MSNNQEPTVQYTVRVFTKVKQPGAITRSLNGASMVVSSKETFGTVLNRSGLCSFVCECKKLSIRVPENTFDCIVRPDFNSQNVLDSRVGRHLSASGVSEIIYYLDPVEIPSRNPTICC
ncbi:4181_t:CDS:1, partial [Paraglomus occultum]